MPSQKVKKQHYVPQFYLRSFANEREQLWVFDKQTGKSFQASIRDVASTKYFYDFHPLLESEFQEQVRLGKIPNVEPEVLKWAQDPQLVEHALAEFEQAVAPIFYQAIKNIETSGAITDEQKEVLAEFLAMQLLRTPESRSLFVEVTEKLWNAVLEQDFQLSEHNLKVEFNQAHASLVHAELLFSPTLRTHMAQILAGHIWLIGVNDTEQPLYTSDLPVVKVPHLRDAGIGSPGIELAFPLNSRYVLCLYERTAFARLAEHDRTTMALTPERVARFNSMQVEQSARQVFCIGDKFTLAEEILVRYPDLAQRNQSRVSVFSVARQIVAPRKENNQPTNAGATSRPRRRGKMRALTHRQRKSIALARQHIKQLDLRKS